MSKIVSLDVENDGKWESSGPLRVVRARRPLKKPEWLGPKKDKALCLQGATYDSKLVS